MSCCRLLTTVLLLLLIVAPARGGEKVQVTADQEYLWTSPEGPPMAVVHEGTALTVVGQRGRWLHVRLNGWIWRPLPPSPTPPAKTAKAPEIVHHDPVELVTNRIDWFPQDYHRPAGETPRAHLQVTLEFANNTSHTLGSIRYRLILRDAGGKVLLSKDVSSDIPLPPERKHLGTQKHVWEQRGGPSGDTYRRLHAAAQKGPLTAEVELISAFFLETGPQPLDSAQ